MNRKPKRKATWRQRLGRQPLPEAERLSAAIHLRLTAELQTAVIADADRQGIRAGVWIRQAIEEKLAREKAEQEQIDD